MIPSRLLYTLGIFVIPTDTNIGVGVRDSIGSGVTKYYSVPFTTGGITLRLDVSIGYITCYASDTFRNPGPGNYVWLINTRGYADGFIDPAQYGRLGTRYIYVALVGGDSLNTYLLNSTIGNFSSQGELNSNQLERHTLLYVQKFSLFANEHCW